MKVSTQLLIPMLAIAAACGGSGSAGTSETPAGNDSQAHLLPSNQEILQKAYDNDYSVPDEFFVDERAATTRSYTVHHVLDDSNSYERCTDDLIEAQQWEAADNEARAVNGYFVTIYENERYFEFVRELTYTEDVGNIADPTSPGYARVFKCTHTNRDGVDRALMDGYGGRVDNERLTAAALRDFSEYLWQFTFFNVSRKKVIDSYESGGAAAPRHTLLLAFVINQGTGSCDRVDTIEWRFSADAATGEISRDFQTVRSFEATVTDGEPRFCN